MKHIGIVGISPIGTAHCYRIIVEKSADIFGVPVMHPEITLHNFSFRDYRNAGPENGNRWERVHDIILNSILKLKKIGADFAIIPANTVHYNFSYVEQNSPLPIINMIETTVRNCVDNGFRTPLILGTKLTMCGGLYEMKFHEHGINCVIPTIADIDKIDLAISGKLMAGKPESIILENIYNAIRTTNCDSIILACTELSSLMHSSNFEIPVIDSTELLADAALKMALQ